MSKYSVEEFLNLSSDEENEETRSTEQSKSFLSKDTILRRLSSSSTISPSTSNSSTLSSTSPSGVKRKNTTSTPVQKNKKDSQELSFSPSNNQTHSVIKGGSNGNTRQNSQNDIDFFETEESDNSQSASDSVIEKSTNTNTLNHSTNESSFTSEKEDMQEVKKMMRLILNQNKEIIERVTKLEEQSLKKRKTDVKVPNDVRYKVRQAYEERKNQGLSLWTFENNPGAFSDCNKEVTKYIRNFVSALYQDLEDRDTKINKAIRTYYQSNITTIRRKKTHPNKTAELAKNQRKIHKADRRKSSLIKYVSKFADDFKENLSQAIVPEMMSSEEESEDADGSRHFIVRKPHFRTKKYEKLIKIIDTAYVENCSKRSKDQLVERRIGDISNRVGPKSLKFGFDWFVKQ